MTEKRCKWDHLWGPEHCPACQRNPFECGCLDVSFASDQEKERQERREKEREMRRLVGQTDETWYSSEEEQESDGQGDKELGGPDWLVP